MNQTAQYFNRHLNPVGSRVTIKSTNSSVDCHVRSNTGYGKAIEIEKLRDETMKLKVELNKKTYENSMQKVEISKIEEDNRKNLVIIEEILREAGRSTTSVVSHLINQLQQMDMVEDDNSCEEKNPLPPLENNNPIEGNNLPQMNLSPSHLIRLREILIISTLKRQVHNLNRVIQEKDEEIEEMKRNSKVVKYSKLETNYISNFNMLADLRKQYETLKANHEDLLKQYLQVFEEREYCKSMMTKFKSQYEDIKIKNRHLEEEKRQLLDAIKVNEEKLTYLSKCTNTNIKGILKEKDTELTSLRTEIHEQEKLKTENEKLEKKIHELQREVKHLQNELDKTEDLKDKLKDEIKSMEEKIRKSNQNNNQLEKEMQQYKKEHESLIKEKKENVEIIKKLKNEIEETTEKLNKTGKILQEKESECIKMEKEFNEQIKKNNEHVRTLEMKIEELEDLIKKGNDQKKIYDPKDLKIIPEVSYCHLASEKHLLKVSQEVINDGLFKTSAGVIIESSTKKNEILKADSEEGEVKSKSKSKSIPIEEFEKDIPSQSFSHHEGNEFSQENIC